MSTVVADGAATRAGFRRFAWGVLAWNVLVVLWGALVRATGSGAGCGNNWPLCNGAVVPPAGEMKTVIEFTHRVTSGLALIAVFVLLAWAWRIFPRGHGARKYAALSVFFIIVEALLGAGLVLLEYVEMNASAGRAVYLCLHLANTLVLLGVLTAAAWYGGEQRPARAPARWLNAALIAALITGVTGAIAALGDTLYPEAARSTTISGHFSDATPGLLRLRLFHPVISVLGSVLVLLAAAPAARLDGVARAVVAFVGIQLIAGVVNVWLHAPVWMQIVHLFLADLMWIALVVLTLRNRARLA